MYKCLACQGWYWRDEMYTYDLEDDATPTWCQPCWDDMYETYGDET